MSEVKKAIVQGKLQIGYQNTIDKLEDLADRIDPDELWGLPGMEQINLRQDQKDRLDAGVNLRRYASMLRDVEKKATPGRVYMRGSKIERVTGAYPTDRGCGDRGWRNVVSSQELISSTDGASNPSFRALVLSDELPRTILMFENQRTVRSNDPVDLKCHLGVKCSECRWLKPIDSAKDMTDEAKDEAKAWTCATHILTEASLFDDVSEFVSESHPKQEEEVPKTKSILTAELEGAALNWAVAKAKGIPDERIVLRSLIKLPGRELDLVRRMHVRVRWLDKDKTSSEKWESCDQLYSPSTDWGQGGPILDEIKGSFTWSPLWNQWLVPHPRNAAIKLSGSTLLVVGLRYFVSSALGPEVDVPMELVGQPEPKAPGVEYDYT